MFELQAYGLSISSVFNIPGYAVSEKCAFTSKADVEIHYGEVSPTGLSNSIERGLFYQINPHQLWLNIPGIARFQVDNGERIVIYPHSGIDDDTLITFIMGPCIAALLMQRDLLVLNGSVLKVDDYAVAYIGQSGFGKSTLLAAMVQKGYFFLADGLCVVNKDGVVFPGLSQIDLWSDSATLLNIDIQGLQTTRPQLKKYHIPMSKLFYQEALLLKKVYALQPQKNGALSSICLMGGDKINFLRKNFYNKTYISGLQKNKLYFDHCIRLAGQIEMDLIDMNWLNVPLPDMRNFVAQLQDSQHDA